MIHEERVRQEERLGRQIVWFGSAGPRTIASIASYGCVDVNHLLSYGDRERFGILGHREREVKGVLFITPLWIWAEED